MRLQLLIDYRNQFSNTTIQQRAKSIELNKVSKNKNRSTFTYKGSSSRPYFIEIKQHNDKIISNCSCPYDYGDLCKHEVAGIDFIIRESNTKLNKDLFGNVVIEAGLENIFLENHLISKNVIDLIKKKCSKNNYYFRFFNSEIESFEKNKITTTYYDYYEFKQTFQYTPATQTLKVTCTCKESKKKYCQHILSGISLLTKKYGEAVFSPSYLEDSIKEYIKPYNLTLEDNYQKFFDFSVNKDGFKVVEKVKNFVPSIEAAKEKLIPTLENKDMLLILKKSNPKNRQYNIGFCLEFGSSYKKAFFDLIPFMAKLKKNSYEFVSSFKEIDDYNFIENTQSFDVEKRLIVMKAIEFQNKNSLLYDSFSIKNLKNASIAFHEFLQQAKNFLFFQKKNSKTLIKKNLEAVEFKKESPVLFFTLQETEYSYTLKAKLKIENKTYSLDSKSVTIYPLFCKKKQAIYLFENLYSYIYMKKFENQAEINFQKKEYPKLYQEIIKPLSEHFEIQTKVFKRSREKVLEQGLQKQVYLSDYEGEYIIFKLGVQYEDTLILLHSKEVLFDKKTQEIKKRNVAFENNFLEEFKELHPDFEEQENVFFLTPYQLIENEWLLKASEKMKHKSITIFGANDLKSFKYSLHKPTITMGVNSHTDWFDLEIEVTFGNEKVSLKEIRKALLRKSNYVQLSNGSLGILPKEWLAKFSTYFKVGEVGNTTVKILNYQFNIIDELHDELESTPQFLIALQKKKNRLQNLNTAINTKPPKNIKATLRPYQLEGLNWLVFLHENNLGGCLADDMGLGKTLQVIAFISYLKSKKALKHPALVIVPTSLIFNWKSEIEKFCPSIKVLTYVGVKRKSLQDLFPKNNIILSTYGSLLNDVEYLKEQAFSYIILDESQAIKNPNSKRYKAAKLLQAGNRLALTGTPIENNTFDLYAQMNFLNPGLLGSISHFKKEFSDAIDKAKDEHSSKLLSKIIAPFLLRRTKEQVATELPEKMESILYCEMGVEQRKVYESFKKKFKEYLLNKIEENGVAKSQMYVLEGLTKLRQICNSPELLNDEEDYGKESVKLDILIENIKDKTANHKILVFSQFTTMLKLIKERLEENDLLYEYLDGKTKNRQKCVDNFQENDDIRVFLISLKAGGVGLNLTKADYVFLIDPWWNPAVENQAIDRCYRIGQDKKVMAYKMICKDTIEEKIVTLQQKKKQVSKSIIQVDNIKKSFNTKQIKELFS
jgi:SNF2 family DNA or RNA helicase